MANEPIAKEVVNQMFSYYSIYPLPVQYCTIIMIDVISLTRQT